MADWKAQVAYNYNYNPSYHAYAYGLVYQPGTEQNHGSVTDWGDNGGSDLSNYDGGATQTYYTTTTTAGTREESPPHSPNPHPVNGHCYQGSGLVYTGNQQPGRLLLSGPQRGVYDAGGNVARRAGSDSASDSEAHTSPDSWSSGSSREGSLPQADPVTWAEKDIGEDVAGRSPDTNNDVSSSHLEEPQTFDIMGNKTTNSPTSLNVPPSTLKKPSTTLNTPKGKVRAAFSESQMNTLVQRFSVQRYLTPGEMKNLAEMTGLTYKQVKTWFQNRRMKLRRHQKDTSWVSERYAVNKDNSVRGAIFSNPTSHIPPYQGDARPQLRKHYTQHMMEAAFKSTPQNLAFYLHAVGGAPRPAGYHSWSPSSSQGAVSNRPPVSGWSMPLDGGRYDYNPNAFNPAGANAVNNFEHNASFETKDGESGGTQTHLNAAMGHNASQ
ncbi:homeobox protein NANOG [Xenentodon cancila]